ncbi:hypothetical protein [Devosia sp. A16]|nr:hypothetical protein [Devosia sp. A16]
MGELLQTVVWTRLGHRLPVIIVAAAAVASFLIVAGLSFYLPMDLE